MCDCVNHVCEKCCCQYSCISIWLLITIGGLITYTIYRLFGYLESKNKIENQIDMKMLSSLTKEKEEKDEGVGTCDYSHSDGKKNP